MATKTAAVTTNLTTTADVTAAPAPAPAPAFTMMANKPPRIWLTDSAPMAMQKMAWLCRQGYVPETMEVFGVTGMANAVMVLGDPDPAAVQSVIEDVDVATAREAAAREYEIQQAAQRIVEERDRAARKAVQDAQIAAAEQALAALKASAQ